MSCKACRAAKGSDHAPGCTTRRRFLFAQAVMAGGGPFLAIEAVSSTAIEHPEWDMEERKMWKDWERGR